MTTVALAIVLVLATIYAVPIAVYGIGAAVAGLRTPEGSPVAFLLGVLVSKLGTAIAFVLIYYFAIDSFSANVPLYVGLWWAMYVLGEIGQAIGPKYSWKEAIAGVISESVYFPVSGFIVARLIT